MTESPISWSTSAAVLHGSRCGSGPAVVLLHGGPGCYDYFPGSALVEWLGEGHTVYSYDQRGCRRSASTGPFTAEANVADLEALRKFAGAERIGLLGHSAGALLGACYLVEHGTKVDWFIALSPAGLKSNWRSDFETTIRRRNTPDQQRQLVEIDQLILRASDPAEREELYRRRFDTALPCYVDPGHRDRAPQMKHYSREVNVRVAMSIQDVARGSTWTRRLARFRGRAAVIHGRSDPIPWLVADEWAALLPRAAVYPLDHCGHFPWLEEPEALRSALFDFLSVCG